MKRKWIVSQAAMAFAMAAMTVLLAAGCDDGMTGAVAAVVAGQQNGTESNHAPSMPDGEIDDDGVLTKYTGNETAVTIPNGVTGIRGFAFEDCTALTDVAIPASVTSIGWGAFYGCESLETVTYNGTLAQWCAMDNDSYLMGNAERVILTGENNMNLKQEATLVIPDEATKIGENAFRGCKSLTGVTIPANVTSIGSNAFLGCTSLKEIVFKGTVEQWQAIQGSGSVGIPGIRCEDGYVGVENAPDYLTISGTRVTGYTGEVPAALVIPDDVTEIGENAFRGCTSLTSVNIPDGVTSIGRAAFCRCKSLVSVTIPDRVTSMGDNAFNSCTSLTSVTIGSGVPEIEMWTFYGCTGLTDVTIGDGVTSIGMGAFGSCTSLTSVTIPDSVTEIGSGAFSGCTSLASVTIPVSVTSIGDDAFYGCTSLTSVNIPDGVKSIGNSAFKYCYDLTSVNYGGSEEQWNAITKGSDWDKNTGDYTITCMDGSLDKQGNAIGE
ncbi:MAG: leucine-rich repeat domain-containing protein [Treponemataceae bacterium]|nr:leucine-rich repeat domain-containing protein [Treponemataceae bacterium]